MYRYNLENCITESKKLRSCAYAVKLTLSEAPKNLVLYTSSESPRPFEIAAIAGKTIHS
jgi:hypothetical protein